MNQRWLEEEIFQGESEWSQIELLGPPTVCFVFLLDGGVDEEIVVVGFVFRVRRLFAEFGWRFDHFFSKLEIKFKSLG